MSDVGDLMGRLPLVGAAREHLMSQVQDAFAERIPGEQYTDPPGDPGLFGPDSMAWRVNSDASMIVGGVAALMQQTLHPLAMAGVAEHSDYRDDPIGRLGRTASFVTATTFGSTDVAEQMIDIVRAVHTRINGVAPDGRPYSAEDPDLLTWVHITEVSNFLRAHQRFTPFPVRGENADRYYAETAVVAERLGATDVPHSRDEVRQYFRDIRPELVAGDQARETIEFLTTPTMGELGWLAGVGHWMVIQAAIALLPTWVRDMLSLSRGPAPVDRTLGRTFDWTMVRPAAFTMLSTLRLAGGSAEPLVEARARCAA